MSDDLVKLNWSKHTEEIAGAETPFGAYSVEKRDGYGWRWECCFDEYYDEETFSCGDMAEGMACAEKHWRERVQPITKHLSSRIEELEAQRNFAQRQVVAAETKLAKAVEALDEAVYLLAPDEKDMARKAGVYRVVTILAALKGQDDE